MTPYSAPVLTDNDPSSPVVSRPRLVGLDELSPDLSVSDHDENRSILKPSLKAAISAPVINSPSPIRGLPRRVDMSGPRPIDSDELSPDLGDSGHDGNGSSSKSSLKAAVSVPVRGSDRPTHRRVKLESVVLFDKHGRPLDIALPGENTQHGPREALRQDVGQPPAEGAPSWASLQPSTRAPILTTSNHTCVALDIVSSRESNNNTNPEARSPPIMPDIEHASASTIAQEQPSLNSPLSPEQIAAEVGVIPGFSELIESLTDIFEATAASRVNRVQWRLLRSRCAMVVRIAGAQVKNNGQEHYPGLENITLTLRSTLDAIAAQARRYSQMGEVAEFLQFEVISEDIKRLFGTLDSCLAEVSYSKSVAQLQWVELFHVTQKQELASLSRIRQKLLDGSPEHSRVDQARPTSKRTEKLRSKGMSAQQMFECLTRHGCQDLTEKVDMDTISVHAVATGAYGDIFKGRLDDSMDVAIKVWSFRRADAAPQKCLKGAMRELYHWSKVDHTNIQKLLGVVMFKDRLGMVSRWVGNGNLQDYIQRNESVDRYQLCVQSAKAVQHLHKEGMVHGDLKAAPELVMDDGEVELRSTRADIYALGMTMLEIITGAVPYFECQGDNQVFCKVSAKVHPERTGHFRGVMGEQLWELLEQCWDYDPALRPSADQVVNSLLSLIPAMALL